MKGLIGALGGLGLVAALGTAITACNLPPPLELTVNTTADGHDAVVGDGICEMTVGADDCSLRAAIEEADHANRAADVTVPAGTYQTGALGAITVGDAAGVHLVGDGQPVVNASLQTAFTVTGVASATGITITQATDGFVATSGSTLVVVGTSFVNGGVGILTNAGTTVVAAASTFTHEFSALVSSGTSTLDEADITDGIGTTTGSAIVVSAGTTTVTRSTISGNRSAGVLVQGGTAHVDRSTIDHNQSPPDCDNAGCGSGGAGPGGIFVENGTLSLTNSTVTGNTVLNDLTGTVSPAGIEVGFASCGAGGCVFDTGTATVTASTVTDPMLAVIGVTTVSGSAVATCSNANIGGGGVGGFVDGGHNVTRTGSACPFDTSVADLGLGPLLDNGGPTKTLLPTATSPLIDHVAVGTAGLCDGSVAVATDQRGVSRPQGPACDTGAVEVAAPTP
jgi:CSLREA domain-containing protein